MIRVTIHIDNYGHEYQIQREDELAAQDNHSTVAALDRLLREAQASAEGALNAVPRPRHFEVG